MRKHAECIRLRFECFERIDEEERTRCADAPPLADSEELGVLTHHRSPPYDSHFLGVLLDIPFSVVIFLLDASQSLLERRLDNRG